MRSLVTYRPYRPSPVNFDRWFDSLFQDWSRPTFATAAPRVDVREQADGYHLEAELPGLSEKDFTVNVEHNLLTIASQSEQEQRARRARLRDPRAAQRHLQALLRAAAGRRRRADQRQLSGWTADGDGAQDGQGTAQADRRDQRRLTPLPPR